MKTAGIFPGQGSEYPGMLECISEYELTKYVFGRINEISGKDIFRVTVEGPESRLREPLIAQLSVFGTSVCYWHLLNNQMDFNGLAGHSLGFYSALYAAGSIPLDDCIRIIIKVHEAIDSLMKDRSGLMASITGLKTEEVKNICNDTAEVFFSNINSASQIVISGSASGVKKACERALQAGALSVKELPIPYPLHSPMMDGIENILRPFINRIEIKKPSIPVISHLDNTVLDQKGISDVLCGQLSKKIMWRDTIKCFASSGINRFVEIGPSDVLSKLVRWIERDAESLRAEEVLDCLSV